MSNTDSFIDEVNDEVRRDRFYLTLRRYGWLAILAVLVLVGGAAWREYTLSQQRAEAEALGDAMLTALSAPEAADRAQALEEAEATLATPTPTAQAVLDFLTAAQQAEAGDTAAAVATLDSVSLNGDVPQIYRQIAAFKALTLQADTLPEADLRQQLAGLSQPGNALRLLAQEQLALLDIRAGDTDAAIAAYQTILGDAEVTADLQQRALQVIVALGGTPDLGGLSNAGN